MTDTAAKSVEIVWDTLEPERNTTYSARIVAAVRDALFDRQLKPGDFLGSEKDIAAKFGVSRMAARDALRTLEATGLVEIKVGAGGGARIASGNEQLFADILTVQLCLAGITAGEIVESQRSLETMAARLAAEHGSAEDFEQIAETIERAENVTGSIKAFTQASLDFHMRVAEASGNRAIKLQIASMQYVVWPRRNNTLTDEVAANLIAVHKEIYQRIAARDADGAAEAMDRHLAKVRDRRMSEYGERSAPDYDQSCC